MFLIIGWCAKLTNAVFMYMHALWLYNAVMYALCAYIDGCKPMLINACVADYAVLILINDAELSLEYNTD